MKFAEYVFFALSMFMVGCASVRNVSFSSHSWRINPISGTVESNDSTYSFTICSNVIESELPLIGNDKETQPHKGLKVYLNTICSHIDVQCDSILFYAPTKGLLVVGITEDKIWKPRSQSGNVLTENPYTIWVRDDDEDDWNRKPEEIYTNVILDKVAKQILVIDRLTYEERDLAIIHIIQTETKKFRSMNLPVWSGTWADVTDPSCFEPISNWIEGHRKVAFENYRRGQGRYTHRNQKCSPKN